MAAVDVRGFALSQGVFVDFGIARDPSENRMREAVTMLWRRLWIYGRFKVVWRRFRQLLNIFPEDPTLYWLGRRLRWR